MKTSDRGIALIKQHEGVRLTAYPDAGYGWSRATIGYGHTAAAGPPAVTKGMRITAAEAEAILRADLAAVERAVGSLVRVPLTQAQFDALVSFAFNVGVGGLSESTLLRKLNGGDYTGAADQFLVWNKSNGKVLTALVNRRKAERALFLSVDPQPGPQPSPAPVQPGPEGATAPLTLGALAADVAALSARVAALEANEA